MIISRFPIIGGATPLVLSRARTLPWHRHRYFRSFPSCDVAYPSWRTTNAVSTHCQLTIANPTLIRNRHRTRPFSTDIKFVHAPPTSKLGTRHDSLASFLAATEQSHNKQVAPNLSASSPDINIIEHSTLIILTNTHQRQILLGNKLLGFGTGKYNGFGGRLESDTIDPTPAHGARRELMEEANLSLPLDAFAAVGCLTFTFDDNENKMVVHLFHVDVRFCEDDDDANDNKHNGHATAIIDPNTIKGCDEMTPHWFSWNDIPLHRMFADDSVWLTHFLSRRALSSNEPIQKMNGWFHFAPGGDETNRIEHYFLDEK